MRHWFVDISKKLNECSTGQEHATLALTNAVLNLIEVFNGQKRQ